VADNVADRMRQLREGWGLSARKLSLDLGLNPNAWNVYETSTSLPGAPILTLLAERGVNVNWLLTGNGAVFESTSTLNSLLRELENDDAQKLGLSRLSLLATESTIILRKEILAYLATRGRDWLSLSDIAQKANAEKSSVALCLFDLVKHGQVEAQNAEGLARFKAAGTSMSSSVVDRAELAALTLGAIKFLSHEVSHGLENKPNSTLMLDGKAKVANGREFLTQLMAFVRTHASAECEGECETLRFVVAATVETL